MSPIFQKSLFHQVLFPKTAQESPKFLKLKKKLSLNLPPHFALREVPLVFFDFETTGLDAQRDRIIEVGAIRYDPDGSSREFWSLIQPDILLPKSIQQITGITPEMLAGQPSIAEILPKFISFFSNAVLVAHNAEFDMGFLKHKCLDHSIELNWASFCTLKLARRLLPQLESKGLDGLAKHYDLRFEARHRSIGDVKVTHAVYQKMQLEFELDTWDDIVSQASHIE